MTTRAAWCSLIALPVAIVALARQDVDDERKERLLLGQRSFENNCLMCHGAELSRQNRLTAGQWSAEIEKMIDWGAPVPDDERSVLHEYLVDQFGSTVPRTNPGRVVPTRRLKSLPELLPLSVGNPELGERLYRVHCLNCHGSEGQGGEPGSNLVDHPVLLEPEPFRSVVRDGSGKMPGFADVLSEDDTDALLGWLRQRRYRPFADQPPST